jgi:TRAP-type C4-dicarboxylate transport system permease small subunit
VSKALSAVRKAVRWTSLALLAALVITPLAQVTMRGIFNLPMQGAEELARYFLICLTFLAASYVSEQGGQIRMEEFQALLPPKPRWLLQLLIELAGVAVWGVLLVSSVVTIARNLNSETAVLQIPFLLFMAPLTVGALLLGIETLAMLVHTWRRRRPEAKQTVLT